MRKILTALLFFTVIAFNYTVNSQDPAKTQTKESQQLITPPEVLQRLKDGNLRYLSGKMTSRNLIEQARATASAQYPYAVILSCLDSRVVPELLFDQGLGDIFVGRVAGNIVNDDMLGSMEFGCRISGAKVILIMGHTNCGAVKGAISDAKLGSLTQLVDKIKPAVERTVYSGEKSDKNLEYVDLVSKENVMLAIEEIKKRSPLLKEMADNGEIIIAGCMYDIETGNVEFY